MNIVRIRLRNLMIKFCPSRNRKSFQKSTLIIVNKPKSSQKQTKNYLKQTWSNTQQRQQQLSVWKDEWVSNKCNGSRREAQSPLAKVRLPKLALVDASLQSKIVQWYRYFNYNALDWQSKHEKCRSRHCQTMAESDCMIGPARASEHRQTHTHTHIAKKAPNKQRIKLKNLCEKTIRSHLRIKGMTLARKRLTIR